MQSTILNGQSLLDMALQECGSFEAAFALSKRRDLALTDSLTTGTTLAVAPEEVDKKRLVAALAARSAKPATAISAGDAALVPWGGIERMGIEIDFMVNR